MNLVVTSVPVRSPDDHHVNGMLLVVGAPDLSQLRITRPGWTWRDRFIQAHKLTICLDSQTNDFLKDEKLAN